MKYTVKIGDTERTYEAESVEEIKNMINAIDPTVLYAKEGATASI